MTLGERLRAIRKERFFTMRDIELYTNINHATITNMENDRNLPSLQVLKRLADFYDMSVQDLFNGVEEYTRDYPPQGRSARGYDALINDPDYKDEIDDDWKSLLWDVHLRGCRMRSKRQWLEMYLHLRRLFQATKNRKDMDP